MHLHRAAGNQPPVASANKVCESDLFLNVHVLLQIMCSLPVTSSECEHIARALHHLQSIRSRITESRLTSLALMNIQYQHNVDLDTIVQLFTVLHQ